MYIFQTKYSSVYFYFLCVSALNMQACIVRYEYTQKLDKEMKFWKSLSLQI